MVHSRSGACLDKARSFHLTQSNLNTNDFLLLCFTLCSLQSHFQTLKIGLFLNTKSNFAIFVECCERSEMTSKPSRPLSQVSHNKHFKRYRRTVILDKTRLIRVISLTVCEVKCRENRLLAEKTGPLSCQVYSTSVYKGCRHIFCIVSRFLFGRICVLHTSKELDPNHYNETFSTRNRHDIINYRESIWLCHHGFGNAVKFQYQLVSRRPSCLVGDCF